jgi:RES domain-containing protein
MRVFRLSSFPDWDGKGGLLVGGRWHHRGTAVIYASSTLSLALVELFVNLDPSAVPTGLLARAADIPDDLAVARIDPATLPRGWRRFPAPASLADRGSAWARGRTTAVLAVPSAVVPQEWNYLVSPLHPDFGRITLLAPAPFTIDPRLWKP